MGLAEVAQQIVAWDGDTKGLGYYQTFDRYFPSADRPVTLLELGVWHGQSTKVFATHFRTGKVIGVDISGRTIDFSGFPNVVFERVDQRDGKLLREIVARHAPGGIDIVIDDAAHIGAWSLASYTTLLPLLNPGGFYVVEDWGTGYWDDWPDGHRVRERSSVFRWTRRKRIPSHDFGMVGFLKSVFEDVCPVISPTRHAPRTRTPLLEFMHLYGNVAVMKKLAA